MKVDANTRSCQAAWKRMCELSRDSSTRNFVQILDMSDYVVETERFPADVLDAYTPWNMELEVSEEQHSLMTAALGGAQGDYRSAMRQKIDNVVDCLTRFPQSKRAVIVTGNDPIASHSNDNEAKCLRELHLYLDENGQLGGSVYFRAQAASIFPKNIHLIGSIMTEVARRLPQTPTLGELFYVTTILVHDRN